MVPGPCSHTGRGEGRDLHLGSNLLQVDAHVPPQDPPPPGPTTATASWWDSEPRSWGMKTSFLGIISICLFSTRAQGRMSP